MPHTDRDRPTSAPPLSPEHAEALMQTAPTLAIVTKSERMRAILSRLATIARSDTSVLLVGETGVGKELFADYVHRASARFDRPFIKLSLSAMPHELLESELFGHERGSFTSAVSDKRGLFDLAHTGTLFLDDIDDVPPSVQVKLLRVLESHQVMRVGGNTPSAIDVRLITASKVDLKDLVARNQFRADLFYRINVCPVEIPALRERREDVPLLAEVLPQALRGGADAHDLARRRARTVAVPTGRETCGNCGTSCSGWRSLPSRESGLKIFPPRSLSAATWRSSPRPARGAWWTATCRTPKWWRAWNATCCGKRSPKPAAARKPRACSVSVCPPSATN